MLLLLRMTAALVFALFGLAAATAQTPEPTPDPSTTTDTVTMTSSWTNFTGPTNTSTTETSSTTASSSTTVSTTTTTSTTSTATSTTTTTSSRTTTTTTSTTTQSIHFNTPRLLPCDPLTITSDYAAVATEIHWWCFPADNPLCAAIMEVVDAAPPPEPPIVEMMVTGERVSAAADQIEGTERVFTITLYSQANFTIYDNITNTTETGLISHAEGSFIFDTTGRITVELVPPPKNNYFEHQPYVEFSAFFGQCGNISHVEGTCNPSSCLSGLTCKTAPNVCGPENNPDRPDFDFCGEDDTYPFGNKFTNRLYCPVGSPWPVMCNTGVCALHESNCEVEYGGVKMNGAPCIMQVYWRRNGTEEDWTESVAAEGNSSMPDLYLPIPDLPGPGDYEIKVVVPNSGVLSGLEFFHVASIHGSSYPVIDIVAPPTASVGCPVVLDASGTLEPIKDDIGWSLTPIGYNLTFEWECQAIGMDGMSQDQIDIQMAQCLSLRPQMGVVSAGDLSLDGQGVAGPQDIYPMSIMEMQFSITGTWRLTLNVTRVYDGKSVGIDHIVTVVEWPAVTMTDPPPELSAEVDFVYSPYVEVNPACAAPELWRTLWLLKMEVDVNGTETLVSKLLTAPQVEPDLLVPAGILPEPPKGGYQFRLVLRLQADSTTWEFDETATGLWVHDSVPFAIDPPPSNGSCEISPPVGNVTTTKFTLFTFDWDDDDLPLKYQFHWHGGPASDTNAAWIKLNSWSLAPQYENMLFPLQGTVSVKASAMDSLGSTAAALGEAEVLPPAVPPSNEELLQVLDSVASSGGSFYSMLSAVESVSASSSDKGEDGVSDADEVAGALLNAINNSMPPPDEITQDEFTETVNVLASVLNAARSDAAQDEAAAMAAATAGNGQTGSTGGAVEISIPKPPAISIDVALVATSFIADVAEASTSMEGGLSEEDATSLVSSVATVLEDGTAEITEDSAQETIDEQEALAENLLGAVDSIADAMVANLQVGEAVSIAVDGIEMTATRQDSESMKENGAQVGDFAFAPGFDLQEAMGLSEDPSSFRRLTAGCDTSQFSIQNTKWPKNPFGYAGSRNTKQSGENDAKSDQPFKVDPDAVQSLNIRACGQKQEIKNASINFVVRSQRYTSSKTTEVRKCMYFNKTGGFWTDDGVTVIEEYDYGLLCKTTHLSSFTGVHGSFSIGNFVNNVLCPNTHIFTMDGINMIRQGTWWHEPGGIALWFLVLLHVTAAIQTRRDFNKIKTNEKEFRRTNSGELTAAQQRIKRLIFNLLCCRCKALFDPTNAAAIGSTSLKVDVDLEEIEQEERDLPEIIRDLTVAKLQDLREQGMRRQKGRIDPFNLGLPDNTESVAPKKGLFRRNSATEGAETVRAGVMHDFNVYFWAVHPFLKLTIPSKRRPWRKQLPKLLVSLFGSFALTALFYTGSAGSNSEYCQVGPPWESWQMMVRCILVAFVTTFVNAVIAAIPLAMGGMSNKCIRYPGLLLGAIYVCGSIFYCALFLANVSLNDGVSWLITASMRFFSFWLITPLLLTTLIVRLEKSVVQEEHEIEESGRESALATLESARQVEEPPEMDFDNLPLPGLRLTAEAPEAWPRQPKPAW